jgi:2-polyprenyl-6-methoxyphenol hydroxylase-like FAD-dependent oxidoreductase
MAIPRPRSDPHVDVLIAGSGPAGATLARCLHRLGRDVLLVTEPVVRRFHPLETLAPAASEQLAFLGLQPALADALIGMVDFEIRWGGGAFKPRGPERPSFLIDRTRFHAALLDLVVAEGVALRAGRVLGTARVGDCRHVTIASPSGSATLTTRLLIDATGRRGLSPRCRRRGHRLMGIHGTWRGTALPRTARIASGQSHWVWGSPAGEGQYVTTLFLDPRTPMLGNGVLAEHVQAAIHGSGVLDGASDLRLAEPIHASDATPHVNRATSEPDFLRIGEAALAIDPLSSAGIQVALQSAASAAVAINTLHVDPSAATLAETFLARGLARQHARHAAWAALFYAEGAAWFPDPFWTTRAAAHPVAPPLAGLRARAPLPAPDQPLSLDPAVRVGLEPCVVGDKIVWHRAVSHPALAEPVAFLDGIDLPALLERIMPGMTAQIVVRDWAVCSELSPVMKIFSWAWRRGVIGPANAETISAPGLARSASTRCVGPATAVSDSPARASR